MQAPRHKKLPVVGNSVTETGNGTHLRDYALPPLTGCPSLWGTDN